MIGHHADSSHWVQRVGFWVGLLLFVVIYSLPVTEGMVEAGGVAVRGTIRAGLETQAARLTQKPTEPMPARIDAYIAAHADWFERESAARAEAMIPAAAVTALVAVWWMTVAIPIPATSLLPLVLFPLLGVVPVGRAAQSYADSNVFLFLGGFIIALGLERCELHRRLALHVVHRIGTGRSTVMLGFMIAGAVISMWISNTATTLMMLPIAMAVVDALPHPAHRDGGRVTDNFGAALMLGIAYACSVGGIATPIGTPPNIAFMGQMSELFPGAPDISFGEWMIAFVPLVAIFIPIIWLVLTRVTCRLDRSAAPIGRDVIRDALRDLGGMSRAERRMLVMFVATALLWVFRKTIHVGGVKFHGWADLLAARFPQTIRPNFIDDATVAMLMAVLLFIIPNGRRRDDGRREHLMDWQTAERLPWGILLLFGGGFAIAAGFERTGLSALVGQSFSVFAGAPTFLLVVGVCLMVTFLTEITSNTATTLVMLPIIARAATEAFHVNPLLLMLPATVSASCAFMLPVATPPNAIVFGSGRVHMGQMVRSGIVLNLIGVALVSTLMYVLVLPLLGASVEMPPWAQ